ncbi:MAG: Stk1 family PASTA domain-containing Ser/Thr kinase [Actinomycetota bacterium]
MERQQFADRYRVEARIGLGGMAEVYRGFDPALERTVAIKVLLPPYDRDAGFVARFRREAQAAARLSHPNIVGVYDTGADGETQYIVMEYIEGRTLASFLSGGGKPTPMQAVDLADKIAGALAAAHAQGIVHRDIKPANVMVTRQGAVKVMDFGIARLQSDATAPQTSSVIGTPAYFSPEQAQGQSVDARSDIYSLGCVLYELLAHRPPFTGDTPVAIAYKQVNESPLAPSGINPDVPPRLDAVVMKCMAKNPANRYQSAAELTADLDRVRHGQDVEATPLLPIGAEGAATQVIARQPTQVMAPPEPESSSKKVWLGVLIGILVVAILAGGGYLLAKSLNGNDLPTTGTMIAVKGVPFATAKSQLDALNLSLNIVRVPQESDQVPDTVTAQDPKEGDQLTQGQTVTLTVAVAPKTVKVPDLTCLTLADATTRLGTDLVLGTKTSVTSDACPADTIVDQDPKPDKEVPIGTFVNVMVASGPATITLENYSCVNFNKAKSELTKLGLLVNFGGTVTSLTQCPNTAFVAQQDPTPGTSVQTGSTVTLYTGSGTTASPSATP